MFSKKFVVGLTGGIGCGKSTVAEAFRELDVDVICADLIARELVAKGHPNLEKIAEHFGEEIIQNGQLNRAELQERIFVNPHEKRWLESLLHPQVRAAMSAGVAKAQSSYVVLDIPLLLESRDNPLVDSILVVDCLPEQQRERTHLRDKIPLELIDRIMAQQVSPTERKERADYLIDNSGTKKNTIEQVKKLHEIFLLKR